MKLFFQFGRIDREMRRLLRAINERTKAMATEFEDLKREVAETQAAVTAALGVATEAVALINDLRTQIVGGLTTEEAAQLAASLDQSQSDLAAKLAELSDAINPNTQVSSGTGSVSPE